jgi:hypothetical protein
VLVFLSSLLVNEDEQKYKRNKFRGTFSSSFLLSFAFLLDDNFVRISDTLPFVRFRLSL